MPDRGMTQAWNGVQAALVRWLILGAVLASITACSTECPAPSAVQPEPTWRVGALTYLVENRVHRPYTLVIEESGRVSFATEHPPCGMQGSREPELDIEWSIRLYEGELDPRVLGGRDPLGGEPTGEPIAQAHSHEHPSFPVYLYILIERFRVGPLDFGPRARIERLDEDPNFRFEFSPEACS